VYKLGALDAGFLYNETARSPQHIASVQILELPEGVHEREFVASFKSLLMERIHLVPHFTNKLQFVPFQLDHPVWVRDTDFDIDNHVHTFSLPAPGGQQELENAIAQLHETRLDRSRPLWDLWVLTGLEGGRVAYYNRVHHACLDGVSGQAMIEAIMDLTPEPRKVEPAPEGFLRKSDRQTPVQLMVGALENFAKYQAKQPLAVLNALETAGRLFQRSFDPNKGLGAASQQAPATRFNKAIGARRAYAMGEMRLDSVKTIARFTHTKVNDVFLAACAGGLRRYLARQGELPKDPMIAGCPVSLRQPGDTNPNNQVTMMLVNLATDETDPAERLQSIAASARTAKGFTQDIAHSYDAEVAMPGLPSALTAGLRLAEATGAANLPGLRLPCNTVISNIPGPQQTLYSCGAKVLTHYPVSIAAHTQGVNITVQSYDGALYFAITACARALPDADTLRDDILAEFEALQALFDVPSVPVAVQQPTAIEQPVPASVESKRPSDSQPKAA
jgi:WS/DGAT/MGAT family acyltransferase